MDTEVARHRTALHRGELSRPLRIALTDGLLARGTSVTDYGCGHGGDVARLTERGYDCAAWDPVHCPSGDRRASDVVNLGYVVNVIEKPDERRDALEQAWRLTKRVLIVSARLIDETPDEGATTPFADGVITRLRTFQKFYEQQELRSWLDQTLEEACVAAAPGIFYVFRDPGERSSFIASRFRRVSAAPRVRVREDRYAHNRALLDPLATFLAERGRLPSPTELREHDAILASFGSLARAFRVLANATEPGAWDGVREARTQDLLAFLALSRFDRRPSFGQLSEAQQLDVRAFFGSYANACARADELLFSLGRTDRLGEACRGLKIGKLMPEELYIHLDALPRLPLLLRLYEGCARSYLGTITGANIVKLKRAEPKVSYLAYPDFETDPHPALAVSTSVDLRTFRVRQRSYQAQSNPPILHRKELFVAEDHPHRAKFARLTRLEEQKGLFDDPSAIGTRNGWSRVLAAQGLALRGHRLVRGGDP